MLPVPERKIAARGMRPAEVLDNKGCMGEVEGREKRGEGSAWMARLSAPRAAFAVRHKVGRREERGEGSAWMARLSAPRAAFAVRSEEVEGREKRGEGSAWMARLSVPRAASAVRSEAGRREERGRKSKNL